MPFGKIKKWTDRGFGFISDDQRPHDRWHFCHVSAIGREPQVGDAFEYAVITDPRDGRTKAVDLKPLETAAREEADRVFGRE